MPRLPRACLAIACVLSMGCYHATVETGAPPSPEVINKAFATGWIYGLIPPSTVSTAAQCPNGVAKVETQLSFVNQLVSFLTLGIYTPMHIMVTCAASRSAAADDLKPDLIVGPVADSTTIRDVFGKAATQAAATRQPVYVQF